jgi:hypothetical protein
MKFLDHLEKETDALKEHLHIDSLEPRTWECETLLVIDDEDQTAFEGKATVEVTPHEDKTADLRCDSDRDGWYPSLRNARIRSFTVGSGYFGGTSDGIVCAGSDDDGNAFVWYINGAADAHVEWQAAGDAKELPPEEPEG